VPFGALYATDGGSSRHRGVDLEAADGERVLAPLAGTVSFAGRVPAVGGGTVLAVTLDTAVGHVTLLPLAHADVTRGREVAEGTAVGTLASAGDGSSADTHLHVGVREGDLYVDPLGVLAAPAAPTSDSGVGQGAGAGSGASADVGVTAGGVADGGATVGGVSESGSGAGGVDVGDAIAGGVAVGGVSAGGVAGMQVSPGGMPAGVSLAPSSVQGGSAGQSQVVGASGFGAGVSLAGGTLAARTAAPFAKGVFGGLGQPVKGDPHGANGPIPQPHTEARTDTAARDDARARSLDAMSAGLSALVERGRAAASRGVRAGAYALVGLLGGIGTLWPLWRGARKGIGKVRVRACGDDVAAAPTR
jgi:hypothetical protein